jgi:DNA modification methylase
MTPRHRIIQGDVIDGLRTLPDASVHCCVTSPPYWGLRDYGHDGQIGLESTPEAYVARMVEVFREVRRVLREDGTLWLNLGDSYAAQRSGTAMPAETLAGGCGGEVVDGRGNRGRADVELDAVDGRARRATGSGPSHRDAAAIGLKHKDLVGIPWRVAFALQADGWWLRQDIIWHKPNPMPESVTDRCTKAHEYVFLLTKSQKYYYDSDAIKEPLACPNERRRPLGSKGAWQIDGREQRENGGGSSYDGYPSKRNKRSVWTVTTKPYSGAHFAVMPSDLVEPCIKAGTSEQGCCPECGAPWERVVERGETDYARLTRDSSWRDMDAAALGRGVTTKLGEGGQTRTASGTVPSLRAAEIISSRWSPSCSCKQHDVECDLDDDCTCSAGTSRPVPCTVLDPFAGSGTTLAVALSLGRSAVGTELNADYVALADRRIADTVDDAALFLHHEGSA